MQLIRGAVRTYAWGSRTAIAEFTGRPAPTAHPEAELWLGAHPGDPARLDGADGPTSLLDAIAAPSRGWLDEARARWASLPDVAGPERRRAVIPIWRRPWMHVGSDTYAGDVLRRLGVDNVLADSPERYPRIRLEELPVFDLVILPDEPYAFTEEDGPESFDPIACALVNGRALTWYGPAMVDAPAILADQLSRATRR